MCKVCWAYRLKGGIVMAVFAFGQCLMKEQKRMYENVYTSEFPWVNSTLQQIVMLNNS